MSESKTPRSDEANKEWTGNYHHCCVDVDFARTLELELNETREMLRRIGYSDHEIDNITSLQTQLTTAQQELKTLKLKCGLCICPEHTTDQACVSCVTEQPNVFQQLEHAQQEIAELKSKIVEALDCCAGKHDNRPTVSNVEEILHSAMKGTKE